MPPSATVGLLAIAACLTFTGPGPAQVPTPNPNANGWHNAPFTVTFGMTCVPPESTYSGPDDANPAPLTSMCDDPVPLVYNFKYDATDPTAAPAPARPPDNPPWYNKPVQVNLNWSDATSGTDGCPADLTYSGGNVTSTCSDHAGNQASESISLPYDADPPTVTISSGPSGVSTERTPGFFFIADESSTFQCQLDGGGYGPCTSPWQPAIPLGDGSHTFSVSAIDQAGNAGAPATRTWTIAELPTSIVPPLVVGAAAEAETLSTDGGSWSGGTPPVQIGIQWQLCDTSGGACTNVAGAIQSEYVVRASDVGQRIRVQVTATNIAGQVFAFSQLTNVVLPLDRTLPQTTIIRQPPNPTNKRAASFTFQATRASATFQCKLDAGAFVPCGSPREYFALAAGTHTFEVRAAFTATNGERLVEDTPAAAIWVIDLQPPPAAGFVRLRAGDRRIGLSWIVPRVADIKGTRVVRVRLRRRGGLVRLLTGSRLTDTGLRNGTRYRYALRTIDKAGNRSLAKVVYGRPRDSLLAPREGAIVSRPPLLRWRARAHATYYNLQLYKVRPGLDRKMLSTWPTRARYQLRQRWFYGGRRVLRPGKYRWYVWPGFGSFAENRYGPLMGTSVFTKR